MIKVFNDEPNIQSEFEKLIKSNRVFATRFASHFVLFKCKKLLIQKKPVYREVYNRYTHCIEDETARSKALSREKFERDVGSRLHNSFEKGKLEGKLETARILKSLGDSNEKIQKINRFVI